jgi:hypothetical protein
VRARQATTTPATTPAILAPRVVVVVVHCVVEHEQSFQAPRLRPHFALLSAVPLAAHPARPSRTRSDARLYLALLFPWPQRRLWHLLRRCRQSLNPFRTGKPPILPRRRTSTSSAPPAVATSPTRAGPSLVVQPASLFASNTSFASASRPTPPPPLKAPSAYTGASSPLAS